MFARRVGALLVGSVLLLAPGVAHSEPKETRHEIKIRANREFSADNGVRSGSGTLRDPYVISGWDVHTLTLFNTSKAVRIVDNTIGDLVLNYAGPNVTVVGNDIGDLRVNENVERRKPPTSGRIARNQIGSVGQIRHFDGRFVRNVVGRDSSYPLPFLSIRAVNFDGFNGAVFAHNTIFGYVEARLHGHHHASGFGRSSHMHASHHDHAGADAVDHTKRWHEVTIAHNTITSEYRYGLFYTDTNHAANDRTAASETNEALNEAHVHRTRVTIADNVLVGGGIGVDVFNAEDDNHRRYAQGSMMIVGNRVELKNGWLWPFEGLTGIDVFQARWLDLHIMDNEVIGPLPRSGGTWLPWFNTDGAGVSLYTLDHAHVMIEDLRVSNRAAGVTAYDMTDSVHWMVTGLELDDVREDVTYDRSTVANEPERS